MRSGHAGATSADVSALGHTIARTPANPLYPMDNAMNFSPKVSAERPHCAARSTLVVCFPHTGRVPPRMPTRCPLCSRGQRPPGSHAATVFVPHTVLQSSPGALMAAMAWLTSLFSRALCTQYFFSRAVHSACWRGLHPAVTSWSQVETIPMQLAAAMVRAEAAGP